MSNAAKNFDILTITLNILHNYFGIARVDTIIFKFVFSKICRYFNRTVLFIYFK